MKGNSKDQFASDLKDKLVQGDLPQGFDQRFFRKLEAAKKERSVQTPKKSTTIWHELISLFAPLGLATAMATIIIVATTNIPTTHDWQARTEVLTKIQTQEVTALSTLPEGEWDYLISSAD